MVNVQPVNRTKQTHCQHTYTNKNENKPKQISNIFDPIKHSGAEGCGEGRGGGGGSHIGRQRSRPCSIDQRVGKSTRSSRLRGGEGNNTFIAVHRNEDLLPVLLRLLARRRRRHALAGSALCSRLCLGEAGFLACVLLSAEACVLCLGNTVPLCLDFSFETPYFFFLIICCCHGNTVSLRSLLSW